MLKKRHVLTVFCRLKVVFVWERRPLLAASRGVFLGIQFHKWIDFTKAYPCDMGYPQLKMGVSKNLGVFLNHPFSFADFPKKTQKLLLGGELPTNRK